MPTPTDPPTIRTIAAQLWRRAARASSGQATHTFARGLTVVVAVQGATRRAAFGRPGVFPSALEVALIKPAFAIPAAIEPESKSPPLTPEPWRILEFTWTAAYRTDPLQQSTAPGATPWPSNL